MPRKTFKQSFIDTVTSLTGGEDRAINSAILRKALGWPAPRYDKIREQLIYDGLIYATVGGPGGSISLTAPAKDIQEKSVKLFISYSHADEHFKNELIKHLSPLRRMGIVSDWHDRKIEAGEKWEEAILSKLDEADIVVLIISIDFINSDYCYVKEMDVALDRASRGETIIVPVIARSCLWKETKFQVFQALPTNGKAIDTWTTLDEPFTLVAEGIKQAAQRIQK